jgi:hypothetical protein
MRHNPDPSYAHGYATAMAECRLDLARLAADFQNELAELRRELAEAKAELARLKAIDSAIRRERDLGMPLQ